MTGNRDLEFVYIGDPMCSWCYGFAPVLDGLAEAFDIPISTLVGGLRPGPMASPVDDRLAGVLAHHWEQVHEASGQPFDHGILARRDWRYDTELPCIAVVAVREQAPEQTLPFFKRLQQAFYAEGTDITVPAPYAALVEPFVPDADAFTTALTSPEMKQRAWNDFALARNLGIAGFPALLFRDGEDLLMVSRGWQPLDALVTALRGWMEERWGPETTGRYCTLDEPC